ncbi:antA/AntB antirepressor family protein [Elizabethkingia anophelis]|nr:antA/AntB antirepressor family protein [Elizabethkingia anophelis]
MEIIKIIERNGQSAVSARELHTFLVKEANGGQIGENFSNWIKRMLDYVDAEIGQDYEVFEFDYSGNLIHKSSGCDNQKVRVHKREYALSLNLAKEISIIQNNDKGKQARRYFIECEKKLQSQIPEPFSATLKLAYENQLKIEQQQIN